MWLFKKILCVCVCVVYDMVEKAVVEYILKMESIEMRHFQRHLVKTELLH